jgi:hypothetical protein
VDRKDDAALMSRQFEDCFFGLTRLTAEQLRLRGQLEDAHAASGFRPRAIPGLHNDLIDPVELLRRATHQWQQTHWPGRSGRVRYAQTLFNLYVVRRLVLLSLRVWDAGTAEASRRLSQAQATLDDLWRTSPPGQSVFVRDARWLIPLAQSPATDDLAAYFAVAELVAEAFSGEDRIEIHKANVCMAAGHLRSQARYHSLKRSTPFDDPDVVQHTRTTNALDFALLVQDLVPLLAAYERAVESGDALGRLGCADVILQGMSVDPELFLCRTALLGAYGTIEHLFVSTDRDGRVDYTALGRRHQQLLHEYETQRARVAVALADDAARFRPAEGAYAPYGVLYGFSSNLIEHMALKSLQPDAEARFGLEDVFVGGDASGAKLAWVSGWRKLPHLPREVQSQFEYPQRFAEDVFDRLEQSLRASARGDTTLPGRAGRLFVFVEGAPRADDATSAPAVPARYVTSTDPQVVAAGVAEPSDERRIASDRQEGRCLVSYQSPGGWVAVSKAVLTDVLGSGHDATLTGVPQTAARALTLLCPTMVVART